jgi:hypothetical protein
MTYAVVVSQVRLEGVFTELHVLDVHRDLELEVGMRLLGQRPEGAVAHLRRLPADLPEVGEILRIDPKRQPFNPSVAQRGQRQRSRAGGRP